MPVRIYVNFGQGQNNRTNNLTSPLLNNGSNVSIEQNNFSAEETILNNPSKSLSRTKVAAISVATMIGRRTISYATSNISKWTGNSQIQNRINTYGEVANIAMMTAINPLLGLANIGVNLATTAIDTAYEQKWDRRRSIQALSRAGYTSKNEIGGIKK